MKEENKKKKKKLQGYTNYGVMTVCLNQTPQQAKISNCLYIVSRLTTKVILRCSK